MARNNRKQSKRVRGNGRSARGVSTTHAPTMNNMQQVENWTMFDLVPVFIQSGIADLDAPVVLSITAGPNSWAYELTQGGSAVGNANGLYGQLSNQFVQIAQSWQTFRNDGVMVEFTPSNFAGLGQASPMASIVDAAGVTVPASSVGDIITSFSRSRTLNVHSPYSKCTRKVDYHNWLIQTVPEPWLLTQNGAGGDGRQLYPSDVDDARTPIIKMAAQFVSPTPGQLIGFIRVAARYQVRGRRLTDITAGSIANLMRCAGLSITALGEQMKQDSARGEVIRIRM